MRSRTHVAPQNSRSRPASGWRRSGTRPQVHPDEDSVALFYLDAGGRRAVKKKNGAFLSGDATWSPEALRQEAASHPERFSPNVVLRPLVQDRLFPTVCYVAGPSELAYQAQLGGVYREFGVEPPLLYPRATVTLIDSSAAKFLDKSKLPLEAFHAQDESALNRLLESQLPPTVERAIEDTEAGVADYAQRLKAVVRPLDPTLAGAVDTTVERIRETLKTLQAKIIHATKRKDETIRRQFTRTRALTFPGGDPQERVLSIVYFMNRYGPYLADRLVEQLAHRDRQTLPADAVTCLRTRPQTRRARTSKRRRTGRDAARVSQPGVVRLALHAPSCPSRPSC